VAEGAEWRAGRLRMEGCGWEGGAGWGKNKGGRNKGNPSITGSESDSPAAPSLRLAEDTSYLSLSSTSPIHPPPLTPPPSSRSHPFCSSTFLRSHCFININHSKYNKHQLKTAIQPTLSLYDTNYLPGQRCPRSE
jgi:hypothetical protein